MTWTTEMQLMIKYSILLRASTALLPRPRQAILATELCSNCYQHVMTKQRAKILAEILKKVKKICRMRCMQQVDLEETSLLLVPTWPTKMAGKDTTTEPSKELGVCEISRWQSRIKVTCCTTEQPGLLQPPEKKVKTRRWRKASTSFTNLRSINRSFWARMCEILSTSDFAKSSQPALRSFVLDKILHCNRWSLWTLMTLMTSNQPAKITTSISTSSWMRSCSHNKTTPHILHMLKAISHQRSFRKSWMQMSGSWWEPYRWRHWVQIRSPCFIRTTQPPSIKKILVSWMMVRSSIVLVILSNRHPQSPAKEFGELGWTFRKGRDIHLSIPFSRAVFIPKSWITNLLQACSRAIEMTAHRTRLAMSTSRRTCSIPTMGLELLRRVNTLTKAPNYPRVTFNAACAAHRITCLPAPRICR